MAKRAGRKRAVGTREPNGRVVRVIEGGTSPAAVRRLRDAALVNVSYAAYGTEYGRLFLADKISAEEFQAAQKWDKLASEAHNALHSRGLPGRSAFATHGSSYDPDPESERGQLACARERRAVQRMKDAHDELLKAGQLACRAVRDVCEDGHPPEGLGQLKALNVGLLLLAKHWHLTPR